MRPLAGVAALGRRPKGNRLVVLDLDHRRSCRFRESDTRRGPPAPGSPRPAWRRAALGLGGGRCVCHHARGSRRSGTAGRRGRRRVVSPAVPPGWPPPPGTLAGSRTPRLVDTTDQGAPWPGSQSAEGSSASTPGTTGGLRPPPKRRRLRHAVVADERKEDVARRFRRGLPSHAEPSCPPRRRASGAAPTPWRRKPRADLCDIARSSPRDVDSECFSQEAETRALRARQRQMPDLPDGLHQAGCRSWWGHTGARAAQVIRRRLDRDVPHLRYLQPRVRSC